MQIVHVLLTMIYVFCCLFLAFVVLLQPGEGGGLAGLAGSSGAVENAMGSKANMAMKKATAWAAALFMVLAVTLGVMSTRINKSASFAAEAEKDAQALKAGAAASHAPSGTPGAAPPAETPAKTAQ